MKKIFVLLATAALAFTACNAEAIDFKAKGNWQVGIGMMENSFVDTKGDKKNDANDSFSARNRIRMQVDAVASESLSGTVYFEIGHMQWGKSSTGGALGADGTIVKVRMAYMDWTIPETDVKVRMGIQNVTLPNKAGGTSVLGNLDVAGVNVAMKLTDDISLTAMWLRPFNDNYSDGDDNDNYLDNMDLWALTLPVRMDGFQASPWVIYGIRGRNTFTGSKTWNDGNPMAHLGAYPFSTGVKASDLYNLDTNKQYGSMVWFGLPLAVTAFDPLNIELELNYGFVEGMGRYDALERGVTPTRGSTQRQGWLAKALVEYKMDWGTPGIFGWYASGDDGDIKNGSERMPSIRPFGKFSSVMGDDVHYGGSVQDQKLTYAGTWGVGLQVRDVSFMENVKHTFRAVYWGGTNSPSMVKYASSRTDWNCLNDYEGVYLTTQDGLMEFNVNTVAQVYENFSVGLRLGYIVNMISSDTWQDGHDWLGDSYGKQDIWVADLTFAYKF